MENCNTCKADYEGEDPYNCKIYKETGHCKFIDKTNHACFVFGKIRHYITESNEQKKFEALCEFDGKKLILASDTPITHQYIQMSIEDTIRERKTAMTETGRTFSSKEYESIW